jgi:hypothetical protein
MHLLLNARGLTPEEVTCALTGAADIVSEALPDLVEIDENGAAWWRDDARDVAAKLDGRMTDAIHRGMATVLGVQNAADAPVSGLMLLTMASLFLSTPRLTFANLHEKVSEVALARLRLRFGDVGGNA